MAIRWYAGRHVLGPRRMWPIRLDPEEEEAGGSTRGRLHRATRVTHTVHRCHACVMNSRDAPDAFGCTNADPLSRFASPLSSPLPLWPVENDTFRNCAASLCEGTCRERARMIHMCKRIRGIREKRGGKRGFH